MARSNPSENTRPLHDDPALEARATEEYAKRRDAQLVADLFEFLRLHPRPWWTAQFLRSRWPTRERMRWLEDRPDVRARITHELTGLGMRTARESEPDFQSDLIERVLASEDVSLEAWETAFSSTDLVLNGPTGLIWQVFRHRFPWDSRHPDDRAVLHWLFQELLTPRPRARLPDAPLLSPLYIRSAIDVRTWQESIPLDLRIQVDACRLRRELEGKPFTCRDELEVVTIERVVELVPVDQLKSVLDALERVLPSLAGKDLTAADLTGPTDEPDENTESLARVLS
ncbi:MAG: hypothetical protein AAF211_20760 [Myxococcota bacterium]